MSSSLVAVLATALTLGGCLGGGDPTEDGSARESRLAKLGLVHSPPANLIEACEYVASQIGLEAWSCPPIVPEGPVVLHPGTFKRQPRLHPLLSLTSESLPGVQSPIHHGHWVFYAGSPAPLIRAALYSPTGDPRAPPPARRKAPHFVLKGIRADVLTEEVASQGTNKNHAVVYWRFADTGYVVSVHGYANAPIAKEIARGLIREMVSYPHPSRQGPIRGPNLSETERTERT